MNHEDYETQEPYWEYQLWCIFQKNCKEVNLDYGKTKEEGDKRHP